MLRKLNDKFSWPGIIDARARRLRNTAVSCLGFSIENMLLNIKKKHEGQS
jgi:hypothetical protein